ncbi:MAG: hypothetical protein Q8P61_06555, partial [Candidatus Nanopelagicales bacterium]|nr:hypothetical protein [Candidatus Nanopelagicales bacterium]
GGPSTVTCSTTMPITRNWALPPCWHGAETSAPDFLDLVRKQIEAYKRATTPDRNVGMHPATPEEARSILTELGLSVSATKLLLANSDPIYGVAVSTISNGEFLVKKSPAGTWEKFPLGSSPEDYCTTAKLSSLGFPAFVQADLVAAKHCWVS